eukprot:3745596-Prymnesium_polylepis.1
MRREHGQKWALLASASATAEVRRARRRCPRRRAALGAGPPLAQGRPRRSRSRRFQPSLHPGRSRARPPSAQGRP